MKSFVWLGRVGGDDDEGFFDGGLAGGFGSGWRRAAVVVDEQAGVADEEGVEVVDHQVVGFGPSRVVIDQNPDGEIAAALSVAQSLALGQQSDRDPAPIEIALYLRDNLPRG